MACRSGGWTTLSSVHFTATAYASVLDSQAALASQDAKTIGARQKAAEYYPLIAASKRKDRPGAWLAQRRVGRPGAKLYTCTVPVLYFRLEY